MDNNFWLNDPSVLFKNITIIIPNSSMNKIDRLNTLTRLLIVTTIILYIINYKNFITIFILGLLLIIILNCNQDLDENFVIDKEIPQTVDSYESSNIKCPQNEPNFLVNAKYEITPPLQFNHDDSSKRSYMNAKYELTPLTDTDGFKEIWRSEPENCGGYTMVPDLITEIPTKDIQGQSQCNYIVRSKIDHLNLPQEANDLISMRPYAEEAYNNSVMAFRDGIMNDHIDRFRRERQHNCADMKLSTAGAGAGGNI